MASSSLRPSTRYERWLTPSIEVVVFVLLFWESLFFMPQMLNADGDLSWHLAIGDYILTTGHVPTQDLFSHSLFNAPFISMEWLSEIFFAMAYRAAGLNGVAWLTAFIIAATYAALARGLRDSGVGALVTFGGALAASVVGSLHLLPRPHLWTIFFFTLFLLLLEKYRRDKSRRVLVGLPVLMVFWANFHGAFISGLALIGMYFIGAVLEKERKRATELLGALVVVTLAAMVNLNGVALFTHNLNFLQSHYLVGLLNEYASPDFHQVNALPFAAALLLSLVMGWRAKNKLGWTELVLILGWTAFALYAGRNIPLYAPVAVLTLAPTARAWLDETLPALSHAFAPFDEIAQRASGWGWAMVAAAVLIGLEANGAKLDPGRRGNTFDANVFPIAAVDALQNDLPPGNMFNDYNWGGYLMLRLYPREKVFIDGRTDFYGEQLTREYLRAINGGAGWQNVLDQYNVRWVIMPPSRPLAERLNSSANWVLKYQDETAGVWIHK